MDNGGTVSFVLRLSQALPLAPRREVPGNEAKEQLHRDDSHKALL